MLVPCPFSKCTGRQGQACKISIPGYFLGWEAALVHFAGYAAQVGFELRILLLHPLSKCWDDRCMPSPTFYT